LQLCYYKPMSENVQTAMFEILKSIQASIVELRTGQAELQELTRKQRRDTAGMLVLMKGVTGVFEERVTGLEIRVTELEQDRQS
jgi:hypothetical protein